MHQLKCKKGIKTKYKHIKQIFHYSYFHEFTVCYTLNEVVSDQIFS